MQNRWSIAVAAAALAALPLTAAAQSTQSSSQQNPPAQSQPPSQAQPPSQQPPAQQPPAQSQPPAQTQPPAQQPPATEAQPAAQGQDAAAAKQHLTEARETLSQLTSLPEAAKLQGDARTQVSQLISNFNALITAQSDWRGAYAKVDENLTTLLSPAPSDKPVGTSGSTAANQPAAGAAQIDPAIRTKLVEFQTHMKAFEKAAGGGGEAKAMAPAAATSSTSNPADPASASASNPASAASDASAASTASTAAASNPPAAATTGSSSAEPPQPTGTSGVTASPTASMDPADRKQASGQVNAAAGGDAQKELDAISAILSESKTGALTKAETTQLKKHVETLRSLLNQK